MENLLCNLLKQKSQILKELRRGRIEDIHITNDGMIKIVGRDTAPNTIEIPIEGLLKEKGISLEEANNLTKKELVQYAFNVLCREIIGEIAEIEEDEGKDKKEDIYAYFEPGEFFSIIVLQTTEIPSYGYLCDVIDVMAEKFALFEDTEGVPVVPKEIESMTDNFLYAACVTKMRSKLEGRDGITDAQALLNAIYRLDFGDLSEIGNEIVPKQGQARDIAHGLNGYVRAARYKDNFFYPKDFAQAKIEGINIINNLYFRMVELGYIEPNYEPENIQDIYELVYSNIDKYLEKIIEEANEIHVNLTPGKINGITRKESGHEGYVNPRVSLAISNHYLDNIFMDYGIGTDEQERALAVSQKVKKITGIDGLENVELYEDNLRRLKSRMLTGLTLSKEGDVQIDGEMYATSDIGKQRENQEDAVLLLKDGDVPGFKMMIVADGVGGTDRGEVASHKLVNKVKEWFEGLSKEQKEHYYSNISDIEQELDKIIRKIANELDYELGIGGSTTFVCAVIGKDETIITNVGDSRAYLVKDGRLEQVSVDDAFVQEQYEKGKIPSKDAMRFHKKANVITSCVGGIVDIIEIHPSIVKNDEYDMVLLFSDGVTDCLSEEEIAVITRTTDKTELSQKLVKRALDNESLAPEEVADNTDYKSVIKGGKDNTTAAVYINNDNENNRDER